MSFLLPPAARPLSSTAQGVLTFLLEGGSSSPLNQILKVIGNERTDNMNDRLGYSRFNDEALMLAAQIDEDIGRARWAYKNGMVKFSDREIHALMKIQEAAEELAAAFNEPTDEVIIDG